MVRLLEVVLANLLANLTTAIFFGVIYVNVVLWSEYLTTLLWAFVVSQALYFPKERLLRSIKAMSDKEDTRRMVWVMWDLITEPFKRMHAEGRPVHEMVFVCALNWCLEVFALVGLVSVTSRLSVWLLAGATLVATALVVIALDRRVFAYRRVVTDNTLACILVITVFFASVSFIVLFLGLESIIEGVSAGQSVSAWARSMVESSETDNAEWSKNVVRIRNFAQETAGSFASQYNETAWFPVARDTFSRYMEHGTLMGSPETCTDDSSGVAAGGTSVHFSGLVDTALENLSVLNVSMEHVVNYGGPSGKIIANGATLLASLGSLIIMVGFKVVLFCSCVFYMTSHDDFLERNIGDFLPVSHADRKRAMTTLRGALHGVFFLPCKVACLHGVVTLLSFLTLQIEFPYFAAFMAVLVSVLPVVPAYIVCWPWALVLVLHGRWVVGVLLAVTQHTILSAIDTELCTQGVRDANPYMTSLSSFLGFAVYGGQGVLLGPLIMCLATLLYGSLAWFLRNFCSGGENSPGAEGGSGVSHLATSGLTMNWALFRLWQIERFLLIAVDLPGAWICMARLSAAEGLQYSERSRRKTVFVELFFSRFSYTCNPCHPPFAVTRYTCELRRWSGHGRARSPALWDCNIHGCSEMPTYSHAKIVMALEIFSLFDMGGVLTRGGRRDRRFRHFGCPRKRLRSDHACRFYRRRGDFGYRDSVRMKVSLPAFVLLLRRHVIRSFHGLGPKRIMLTADDSRASKRAESPLFEACRSMPL